MMIVKTLRDMRENTRYELNEEKFKDKDVFLKCLMMADTFDILPPKDDNKYEFKIILTYYTHDIYYKGEKENGFNVDDGHSHEHHLFS